MSELKKGDKVTALVNRKAGDRVEYTLAEDLPAEVTRFDIVKVVKDNGDHTHVWADTVEPAPGPQVGDRVRVVYEGRVTNTSRALGDVSVYTDTGHSILTGRSATSIEVLERAPYPIGTAVVLKTTGRAFPLLRDHDGWRNHAGELTSLTDERVRAGHFEVVYEPKPSS